MFYDEDKWMSHLSLGHGLDPDWTAYTCELCLQETGTGKLAIIKHLATHLEEISLAAITSGAASDTDSEDSDIENEEVDTEESVEKQSNHSSTKFGGESRGVDPKLSPPPESLTVR